MRRTSAGSSGVPVFNLTVEGSHEFFANGILVHNCDNLSAAGYLRLHDKILRSYLDGELLVSPGVDEPLERSGATTVYRDRESYAVRVGGAVVEVEFPEVRPGLAG